MLTCQRKQFEHLSGRFCRHRNAEKPLAEKTDAEYNVKVTKNGKGIKPMNYKTMPADALSAVLKEQKELYKELQALHLSYDMTRGKPGSDQLDLSNEMLSEKYVGNTKSENGTECRNYGVLDGIPEAKKLMADMLGVAPANVIIGGNSSLNMMYDTLVRFMLFGTGNGYAPWSKLEKVKFICPVPGYDRHFLICEKLGIEMIPVELQADGPDMDAVYELVKDPAVKGMWSIPKYSNPSGIVYSDEKIRALASMQCAAEDFRIMWDDAYTVHFLGDAPAKQINMLTACCEAGNPERVLIFGSTSKITFPGSGLAVMAGSEANIKYALSHITVQTIGHDKLNQLRHANFLHDYDGILRHMKKHADILKPKFDAVLDVLETELAGTGILEWTKPEGGYFISINTLDGCATKVVSMAKECGVLFTPAGATFPYRKDPRDRNIRIAPTLPPLSELTEAIKILCICIKICSAEKLLAERGITE